MANSEVGIADVCAFLAGLDEGQDDAEELQPPAAKQMRFDHGAQQIEGLVGFPLDAIAAAPGTDGLHGAPSPEPKSAGGAGSSSSVGSKEKVHPCPWPNCGKKFSSRWGLDRHHRIHTGEKPWVCQIEGCGKGFVDRALLARHERTHSKDRPFFCPHPGCDKKFKVQKHLEYHLQLHATPDIFCCGVDGCKKNFSNPSSLRIHRLLDHESPDSESTVEKQLREELTQATSDLEATKEQLGSAQQSLTATVAEGRELRRQMKLLQPRLQCLRKEHELLAEAIKNKAAA